LNYHDTKVSIAIPFFNNAATLGLAIQSVFAQTLGLWELLLLDDGSRDDSLKIAQDIRDPRVRVLTDGKNRGLVYRLNQAAGLARAPLLARMDADDIMHPERLATQVHFLESNRETHLVGSAAFIIDTANNPVGLRDVEERRSESGSNLPAFIHPTIMARTKWFQINPYDERYVRAEDVELWFRTRSCTVWANLRQPLLFYREAGCFSLKKYLRSASTMAKILRVYGPAVFGAYGATKRAAASLAKCGVYAILAACRQQDRLLRTRNRALTVMEEQQATVALSLVVAAQVPGLLRKPASEDHSAPGCTLAEAISHTPQNQTER
jgi:glycosyltransferase involved in cell wall biosynthesis